MKSSFCYYKQWGAKKRTGQGHKPVIPLRFSKNGAPEIEINMGKDRNSYSKTDLEDYLVMIQSLKKPGFHEIISFPGLKG